MRIIAHAMFYFRSSDEKEVDILFYDNHFIDKFHDICLVVECERLILISNNLYLDTVNFYVAIKATA